MIKLVAFDWNGTLLSDTAAAYRACNDTYKVYGMKPISINQFRKTFVIPIKDMWKANNGPLDVDFLEQSKIYHPLYEKHAIKSRTRAGAKDLLKWLKEQHILRMIYSNHVSPDIIRQLIRLDIHEYFDEVLARPVGDHSIVHSKSKDQKLKDYVLKSGFKPNEVLTIGDTEEEIQIGKACGFFTAAITGGYNTEKRLKKQHPDFLIHNLKDLKSIIIKLKRYA